MATYTGVADANGDFNIPFSSNYTSAQKVTVTAEKDGAEKSIELYAPSDTTGGGNIRFTGNVNNYPLNIGGVELHGFIGTIGNNVFDSDIFSKNATSLLIGEGLVSVGNYTFRNWTKITKLTTPTSLKTIGEWSFSYMRALERIEDINPLLANLTQTTIPISAFYQCDKAVGHLIIPDHIIIIDQQAFASSLKVSKVTLGTAVKTLGIQCINFVAVQELICKPTTPPTGGSVIDNIPATALIRVPVASLNAYKTASGWSAKASQMVGY